MEDEKKNEENTDLLKRKRKNKSQKKRKSLVKKADASIKPTLEIIELKTEKEETQTEVGEVKDRLLLIVKKNKIIFKTEEEKFIKGRKIICENEEIDKHYYDQRYYFFSLFDEGIQMDKESWFSVTPEEISNYISTIFSDRESSSILDAFCGCGGNTISFSKNFKTVYANDISEIKINFTKNNTKVYKCPNNIIYSTEDYLKFNLEEKVDYVFLSPPWGGPEYKSEIIYSVKSWITPDIEGIIKKSLSLSKNLIFYLPRNTDLEELANILYKYDKKEVEYNDNTILIDVRYLHSAGKIKAIIVLYGEKFNTIKIKLMREYLLNSFFNTIKRINHNKLQKQINILRVIGYSQFIRVYFELKEKMEKFLGNSSLDLLEKHFLEKVLDENEKSELEDLCKKKNVENNDEKKKLDPKIQDKIKDEFIDIREPLSEENFLKVVKYYFP